MKHPTIVALGLLAAALVPAVQAQENEAEKLFREMEKKVTSAKAVRVASDDKVHVPGIRQKWMLVFAEGNKCRLAGTVESQGKAVKVFTISDGAKLLSTERGTPMLVRPKEDAPKDLTNMLQGSISRCGMSVQFFAFGKRLHWLTELDGKKQGFKIDEDFKVTDFALGDKEKVGEHEAQVVRYNLFLREVKLSVSVWLDAKTKLPLKRVTKFPDKGEQKLTVTETFTELTLNPKLEPKAFELPKD
jgi:outer membrane lipoprotein-sorting protein